MRTLNKTACTLAAVALLGMAATAARAQGGYPAKPVRIIVAYQAGQGTDLVTRYVAEHLSKALGQPFVVENLAGAGGTIGTQAAARAAGDGYTLTMGTNATHVLNAYLYASLSYDAARDFEPVTLVGTLPMVLVSNAKSTLKSVQDVLSQTRQSTRSMDVGLPSTTARLVFELFKAQSNANVFSIPYNSSSQSLTDLIGGQVPLAIDTITATRSHITAGKLHPVAVTSRQPTDLLPGVRPVASQGLPDFEVVAWNALYAPKGTPAEVIERLSAELQKFLARPETRQRLLQMGMDAGGGTPQDLARFADSERRKWAPVIKNAGLTVQ